MYSILLNPNYFDSDRFLAKDVLSMLKLQVFFSSVKIALVWLFGRSMQIICLSVLFVWLSVALEVMAVAL